MRNLHPFIRNVFLAHAACLMAALNAGAASAGNAYVTVSSDTPGVDGIKTAFPLDFHVTTKNVATNFTGKINVTAHAPWVLTSSASFDMSPGNETPWSVKNENEEETADGLITHVQGGRGD